MRKFIIILIFLSCINFLFLGLMTITYAADYYWVGGITNSNTSNPDNWDTSSGACADSGGAAVPGASDSAYFTSDCTNDAIIDSDLSVAGFYMTTYAGTVTNSSSLIVSGTFNVNSGTLNVVNGAQTTSSNVSIGNASGYTGTVTISGSGSSWINSASFFVGRAIGSSGILTIQNGATATCNSTSWAALYLGSNITATGTVTIDGSGSSLTVNGAIRVGETGSGTLTVSNGGTLTSGITTRITEIGYAVGSSGSVTVDGLGSIWTITNMEVDVGRYGNGTLTVSNGGVVNNYGDGVVQYIIGGRDTDGNGTIIVDGDGSTITTNRIYVPEVGNATLSIQNGGLVNSIYYGIIGAANSGDGTVTIDGTGSKWVSGGIYIMHWGSSTFGTGILNVNNGATVEVGSGTGIIYIAKVDTATGIINIGDGYTMDLIQAGSITVGSGVTNYPSDQPTNLSFSAAVDSISWDWDDMDRATGYKIYNASTDDLLATISSATSNWQQNSLSSNTSYSIYVRGTNSNGEGYASTSSAYTLTNNPTNLSASSGRTSINLTVDSFSNDTSGQSGYQFSSSAGGNSGWIQNNFWEDTGLFCDNSYTYSVKYRNGDGTETDTISIIRPTTHCQGSALPFEAYSPPSVPVGGFKITVNQNQRENVITNRVLTLNFNAGPDVRKMAVSLTGDFTDASQEDYSPAKQIDLCSKFAGAVKSPSCPFGSYTVYLKFYTKYGRASEVVSTKINFIADPQSEETILSLNKDLSLGFKDSQVKALQEFLNQNGYQLTDNGFGSPGNETDFFGPLTSAALVEFQEANKDKSPEMIKEKGFLGLLTRQFINSLIKAVSAPIQQSQTSAIFTESLYKGLQSEDVRRLQILLASKPEIYPEGLITGYFGLLTEKAVQLFQLNHGVVDSPSDLGFGYAGPKTRAKLKEVKRRASNTMVHPTQKPIELVGRAIRNSSKRDGIILDLFGGSGSTLISAEKEGRKAFLMELDPKYCDVILSRFEKFTGKKAVKIN